MQKTLLFISVLTVLLLVGCASDLPAEPSLPGTNVPSSPSLGQFYKVLLDDIPSGNSWASKAVDVFNANRITSASDSINQIVTIEENPVFRDGDASQNLKLMGQIDNGYIYKTAAYFNKATNSWTAFELTGPEREGNWFKGGVFYYDNPAVGEHYAIPGIDKTVSIPRASINIDAINYVIVYACSKQNSGYQCGCKEDSSGQLDCSDPASGKWNWFIVPYYVTDEADSGQEFCSQAGGDWVEVDSTLPVDPSFPGGDPVASPVSFCCGDDSGEAMRSRTRLCDEAVPVTGVQCPLFPADVDDSACSSSSQVCVYNGVLYADGSFLDSNGNGINDAQCTVGSWGNVDELPAEPGLPTSSAEQVNLHAGKNFVAFPKIHEGTVTARQFLNSLGGACNSIQDWKGSRFESHHLTLDESVNNFAITSGKGYSINCESPVVYSYRASNENILSYPLSQGWSFIGPTRSQMSGFTTVSFLQEMNAKNLDCSTIGLEPLSPAGQIAEYTITDAPISLESPQGFMVRCNTPGTWRPGNTGGLPQPGNPGNI